MKASASCRAKVLKEGELTKYQACDACCWRSLAILFGLLLASDVDLEY